MASEDNLVQIAALTSRQCLMADRIKTLLTLIQSGNCPSKFGIKARYVYFSHTKSLNGLDIPFRHKQALFEMQILVDALVSENCPSELTIDFTNVPLGNEALECLEDMLASGKCLSEKLIFYFHHKKNDARWWLPLDDLYGDITSVGIEYFINALEIGRHPIGLRVDFGCAVTPEQRKQIDDLCPGNRAQRFIDLMQLIDNDLTRLRDLSVKPYSNNGFFYTDIPALSFNDAINALSAFKEMIAVSQSDSAFLFEEAISTLCLSLNRLPMRKSALRFHYDGASSYHFIVQPMTHYGCIENNPTQEQIQAIIDKIFYELNLDPSWVKSSLSDTNSVAKISSKI